MAEMVGIAESVDAIACAHPLEAEVRELRLIAEHKPRYNRRSRFPERVRWLKLTDEPFPRLALVRRVADDGATYLGPFGSAQCRAGGDGRDPRGGAAAPVQRSGSRRREPTAAVRARRHGPLRRAVRGRGDAARSTPPTADAARALLTGDPRPLLDAARRRMAVAVGAGALRGGGRASRPRRDVRPRGGPDAATGRRLPSCRTAGRGPAGLRRRLGPRRRPPRPAGRRRDGARRRRPGAVRRGRWSPPRRPSPPARPARRGERRGDGRILGWLAEPGARLVALDGDGARRSAAPVGLHWLAAAEAGREPPGRSTTAGACARCIARPAPWLSPLHRCESHRRDSRAGARS